MGRIFDVTSYFQDGGQYVHQQLAVFLSSNFPALGFNVTLTMESWKWILETWKVNIRAALVYSVKHIFATKDLMSGTTCWAASSRHFIQCIQKQTEHLSASAHLCALRHHGPRFLESLVRIYEWHYCVYIIWKDVQCFHIPKVNHRASVRDKVSVRFKVKVRVRVSDFRVTRDQ